MNNYQTMIANDSLYNFISSIWLKVMEVMRRGGNIRGILFPRGEERREVRFSMRKCCRVMMRVMTR